MPPYICSYLPPTICARFGRYDLICSVGHYGQALITCCPFTVYLTFTIPRLPPHRLVTPALCGVAVAHPLYRYGGLPHTTHSPLDYRYVRSLYTDLQLFTFTVVVVPTAFVPFTLPRGCYPGYYVYRLPHLYDRFFPVTLFTVTRDVLDGWLGFVYYTVEHTHILRLRLVAVYVVNRPTLRFTHHYDVTATDYPTLLTPGPGYHTFGLHHHTLRLCVDVPRLPAVTFVIYSYGVYNLPRLLIWIMPH